MLKYGKLYSKFMLLIMPLIITAIMFSGCEFLYDFDESVFDEQLYTDSGSDTELSSEEPVYYTFRNDNLLEEHFEKHNENFDYADVQEYLDGANRVINDKNALHKLEAEDGDDVYYLEDTNEFVIVSTDGYIRTYFKPSQGIDYYNRQ